MFHWKTEKVVEELNQIPEVKEAKAQGYGGGGDYDTVNIMVSAPGSSECLYVAGFYSTEECIPDPNDAEVTWVEITDGLDSRGGLNSTNDNLAMAYIKIRQYFAKRGATVINHYKEIF